MLKTKINLEEMLQDLEDHKRDIEFIHYKSSMHGSGAGYFIPEHTKPYKDRQQQHQLKIKDFGRSIEFDIIKAPPKFTLMYYTSVDRCNIDEINLIKINDFNYYQIIHKDDTILEIFFTV